MKEKDYYLKLGTTQLDYYKSLAKIVIEEKERAGDTERIYYFIFDLKNKRYHLAELEEGATKIKNIIHSEEADEMGYTHIIIVADDLKAKGFYIFSNGKSEHGKFNPFFTIKEYSIPLRRKLLEFLKDDIVERKETHDKAKK